MPSHPLFSCTYNYCWSTPHKSISWLLMVPCVWSDPADFPPARCPFAHRGTAAMPGQFSSSLLWYPQSPQRSCTSRRLRLCSSLQTPSMENCFLWEFASSSLRPLCCYLYVHLFLTIMMHFSTGEICWVSAWRIPSPVSHTGVHLIGY